MADLVRHDARHLRAVLGLVYEVGIEDQDAARQGEGVDRAAFHHVHGDLVRIVGRLGQTVGEIVQRFQAGLAVALVLVGRQLVEHALAELDLQAVGQERCGIFGAVVDGEPEQADQCRERGAEGGDASGRRGPRPGERRELRHQRGELPAELGIVDHQARLGALAHDRRRHLVLDVAQHGKLADRPARQDAGVGEAEDHQLVGGGAHAHVVHQRGLAVVVAGHGRHVRRRSRRTCPEAPRRSAARDRSAGGSTRRRARRRATARPRSASSVRCITQGQPRPRVSMMIR